MSESKLEAVIWDMDGVIADTGPYHLQAWQYVFRKRGVNYTAEDFQRSFGQRNDTIIRKTLGDGLSQTDVEAIANEKEENYRQRVTGNIKALPGAIMLIKTLKERGVKLAVASSAPPENIRLILSGLGIEGQFDAVVWGREVSEGKPSPQAFLLAAKRLGIQPRDCAVIEDAVAGVSAAKRAGMKCVAVTNTHPRASLKEADMAVDSLEEVTVDTLSSLFNLTTGVEMR